MRWPKRSRFWRACFFWTLVVSMSAAQPDLRLQPVAKSSENPSKIRKKG